MAFLVLLYEQSSSCFMPSSSSTVDRQQGHAVLLEILCFVVILQIILVRVCIV